MLVEYGKKTWQNVTFEDIFPDRKRNRIIGLTFPHCNEGLGLEPSILTVLPPDDNVEFAYRNLDYNDGDVQMYLCSVYISGYKQFIEWSLKHDRRKIVVGGYHPTTFPEDFVKYADKIVVGPCDDIFATIAQEGQTVTGITTHKNVPRRDLYDITKNQQIIPDKMPDDVVVSINTSIGCNTTPPCDFCCTPMMCPTILSKPIDLVEREVNDLRKYHPKFMFIRDENFTMQKDWKERLTIIYNAFPQTKKYLFASANTLNEERIEFMRDRGVYMICLGLEDPTKSYSKNKTLDHVVDICKQHGMYTYLSFIVNPLEIIGKEQAQKFYEILMNRIYELRPEMVCGNFLMPFRGTKLWDKYYAHVSEDDYAHYDSKTPFLVKNAVLQEKMKFFMFWYQWVYYTSDVYNKNVRQFAVNDMLHLRFVELYEKFKVKYERIWDCRA